MSDEPERIAPRRSYPLPAWLIILAVVVFIVLRVRSQTEKQLQRIEPQLEDSQARWLIGAAHLHPTSRKDLARQATELAGNRSCIQQLRLVLLLEELQGPEAARKRLEAIRQRMDSDLAASEEDRKLLTLLEKVVDQRSLTAPEENELEDAFGWLATFALSPPESAEHQRLLGQAKRTALAAQTFLLAGFLGCVLGAFLLALLVQGYRKGRVRSGLAPGQGNGGVYAETFALWMLLYLGFSALAGQVVGKAAPLLVREAVVLATLAALFWPWLRGVSWRELRQDLGLTTGKGVGKEALFGLGTNLASLPILALLFVLLGTVLRLVRQHAGGSDSSGPGIPVSHPVEEILLRGSVWDKVQVVLAAAVLAPLVEEILFRGLLYRHLREATAKLGTTGSVVVSGVLSGLVFAAIHPQGLLAVPLLGLLALAFALVREWRNSLIACMVAHGVNNAVVTLVFISAVAG